MRSIESRGVGVVGHSAGAAAAGTEDRSAHAGPDERGRLDRRGAIRRLAGGATLFMAAPLLPASPGGLVGVEGMVHGTPGTARGAECGLPDTHDALPAVEGTVPGTHDAAPGIASGVVIWEGRGRQTAYFNCDQGIFWKGRGKVEALANIRGSVLWEGRGASKPILSVDSSQVAWEGRGRVKPIFSMDSNKIFWEGRGRTKALASLVGKILWEGRGRTKAIASWDTDLPGEMELFATVWLLLAPGLGGAIDAAP